MLMYQCIKPDSSQPHRWIKGLNRCCHAHVKFFSRSAMTHLAKAFIAVGYAGATFRSLGVCLINHRRGVSEVVAVYLVIW
uniref:DUF2061 domain-containing protein n=1 Tax=Panagrellus redivivus TaxID=6233 RepID=A0A7E4V333_PANRE